MHRGTAPKSMKSLVGIPFKPKYVTLSGKSGSCLDTSTTTLIFHLLPAVVENISFRYEMINRKKNQRHKVFFGNKDRGKPMKKWTGLTSE